MKTLRSIVWAILGFVVPALLVFSACKKRDRLTTNSYQLTITPSATSVARNNARTFTAQGISSNGSFQVEPQWQVLESTSGAVPTPSFGPSVSVSFPNLGVYTLVADFDGRRGVAQIRVESSTSPATAPPVDSLLLYTDAGLPSGADIFTNLGTALEEQKGTFDAPEGSNYMRASNMTAGTFWSLDLQTRSVDLGSYPGGKLKFSIRLSQLLKPGELLTIQMGKADGSKSGFGTNLVGWNGFTHSSTDWQSVSIDLSHFFSGTGLVQVPFLLLDSNATNITVDIDNVRWEKN